MSSADVPPQEPSRRPAFAWDPGRGGRLPLWLWLSFAAMFVSVMHIVLDFGVGLFNLHGTLSLTEATTVIGVAGIQVWWAVSLLAGAQGHGGGVLSAAILGAGWGALTNGFPIVYCPPICPEARPLTDIGHIGSIAFGILVCLVALWTLFRDRVRPGWILPTVALALVLGTLVSLANTPIVSS